MARSASGIAMTCALLLAAVAAAAPEAAAEAGAVAEAGAGAEAAAASEAEAVAARMYELLGEADVNLAVAQASLTEAEATLVETERVAEEERRREEAIRIRISGYAHNKRCIGLVTLKCIRRAVLDIIKIVAKVHIM